MTVTVEGLEVADRLPRDEGRRLATLLGVPFDRLQSVTLDHAGATAVVMRRDVDGLLMAAGNEVATTTVVVPWSDE